MSTRAKSILALSTAACLAIGGVAVAGSGNNAFVIQETPRGATVGNSLSIDQSGASNSAVAGVGRNDIDLGETNTIQFVDDDGEPLEPDSSDFLSLEGQSLTFDPDGAATQSGIGNSASIDASNDTQIGLLQSGNINSSTIDAGSGQVLLYQDGNGNNGSLTTENGAALASLLQDGNGNTGTVTVSGLETQGLLTQIGDNNDTTLDVETQGATVSFTVEGSNTSNSASLPASVVSTAGGGQITIIQRPLGTQ